MDPAHADPLIACPELNGRYDTVCEIWIDGLEVPKFNGVAKLHPKDKPDKIEGKRVALREAIGLVKVEGQPFLHFKTVNQQSAFYNKSVRTEIWKAFWEWVASWNKGKIVCKIKCSTRGRTDSVRKVNKKGVRRDPKLDAEQI